ncbi:hypothetical protein DdX_13776 [Ditylenchus destructor]|uniref:Uncharacterized protein n=1 Tax=Ditylenchus destructor TaxID=166010 RepID=A0AAD4MSY5_9BILA|nr:hypothetical protein DdX_13776 [Ditylenchus destructor]
MRRSTRLAARQTKSENEARSEPKLKKKRPENKITNIASMDNGTTLETFKYLNYSQLAKTSLNDSGYSCNHCQYFAKIFNKRLSPIAYKEWIVRNNYSQQLPLENESLENCHGKHPNSEENDHMDHHSYDLSAYAFYKDPNRRRSNDKTTVFWAGMELENETWPFLQHFVRLLTDPFIYIRRMDFVSQKQLLNILTEAMNPESGRLHCEEMHFYLEDNVQKFMDWIRNNVHCDELQIYDTSLSYSLSTEDVAQFFITGGNFTSSIVIRYIDLTQDHSYILVDLVQKFMELKNSDKFQLVGSIQCNFPGQILEVLQHNYAKFIVNDEKDNRRNSLLYQILNKDIGKKLQLTTRVIDDDAEYSDRFAFDNPSDTHILVGLEIENL